MLLGVYCGVVPGDSMRRSGLTACGVLLSSLVMTVRLQGQEPVGGSPTAAGTGTNVPATSAQPTGQPVANPNGSYTLRANARLVVLDLVVEDAKGNVVRDL